ncbi:MAG: sigma factor-like helix-turn-helix DNA-binding protein [Vulcanimicrobiota bacterium]
MQSFEHLYNSRADYLYFMCQRLEESETRIESLFFDVWRRIHRDLIHLGEETEEKWLCRKLVEAHRQLHRRAPVEEVSTEAGLLAAVVSLGLEYRWALVLRECGSFSYLELGEILGVPERTVRSRIARARAQVRRYLEAHE